MRVFRWQELSAETKSPWTRCLHPLSSQVGQFCGAVPDRKVELR
jgi:hypothetical protein